MTKPVIHETSAGTITGVWHELLPHELLPDRRVEARFTLLVKEHPSPEHGFPVESPSVIGCTIRITNPNRQVREHLVREEPVSVRIRTAEGVEFRTTARWRESEDDPHLHGECVIDNEGTSVLWEVIR